MRLSDWHEALQNTLGEHRLLGSDIRGRTCGTVLPPDLEYIAEFVEAIGIVPSPDFMEFYTTFQSMELPLIGVEYSIFSLRDIVFGIQLNALPMVMYIDRPLIEIPFGGDAGGNLFAAKSDGATSAIYYLQREQIGVVESKPVYFPDPFAPKLLGESMIEFLEAVLEETRADLEQRPGWKYLDHGLYGPEPDP